MKLVVIGLDGACFELIDPWIDKGDLPNIAKIKKSGVWADMHSVMPPVTSPNWKCYSTGKNPGKLGIFYWENIDWENHRVYFPSARLTENKEIWDYIGEQGMKVGITGMPLTYPPKKVNGFLISGAEAGDTKFTYPGTLEEELNTAGWRNLPRTSLQLDNKKASQEIHEIIDSQFRVAQRLGEQYQTEFLQITIFPINVLQHYVWDAPATKIAWQIIDKYIGDYVNKGCDLIIMSDHGSNKIELVFNINAWLQRQGYLQLNLGATSILNKLGISQQNMLKILSKLRALELVRKIVPSNVRRSVVDLTEGLSPEAKASKTDWQRSQAIASGHGPIYINPLLKKEMSEELRNEIKQKLESLTDPTTGHKIAERVYHRDEIYKGKYLTEAPDLVIDQAKGIHITGGIGYREIFGSPQKWQAENKKFGFFMAYGPTIKPEGEIENVSILDLAPTILHLFNIAVPEDMDGRVLKEIFKEDSEIAQREVRYQTDSIEKTMINDKIKKLKEAGKL